jgi:hypothetical protein
MSSKTSQLPESTIGNNDYFRVARSGSNFKLSPTGMGAYGNEGGSTSGRFVRFFGDGEIRPYSVYSSVLSADMVSVGLENPGGLSIYQGNNSVDIFAPSLTASRLVYLADKDGYISIADASTDAVQHGAYQYNYSNYIYNSGNLSLSSAHNGKTIISTNTTGITYTVASGLSTGYSCSLVQYGTGLVSITGAAGISVNSYGGLTNIAGQYGSAYVSWVQNNSYLLAGNLA